MSKLELVCAAETNYLPHCAAMLESALDHRDGMTTHVHLLHGPEVRERSVTRLAEVVARHGQEFSAVVVPDELCSGLPTEGFTGKATWYRLFASSLLADTAKCLFLDSDLLVLDGLRPLWDIDLGENYVGAVTNMFMPQHRARPQALGLPSEQFYFNAGVLLLNLSLLRRESCADALLATARARADEFLWRDQDTLNVVLGHRRLSLHPRWNSMNVFRFPWGADGLDPSEVAEARRAPAIRHFEGPDDNKPWHLLSVDELRPVYREYRRRTPWPLIWPTGVTPGNLARGAVAVFRGVRRRAVSSIRAGDA